MLKKESQTTCAEGMESTESKKKDDAQRSITNEHLDAIGFDYKAAQGLPLQCRCPSEIYFDANWSVNVFGISDMASQKHTLYHYDEQICAVGKGCSHVLSLLIKYFHTRYNLTVVPEVPRHLVLYADNCSAQNKNKHLLQFIALLCASNIFKSIRFKFLVTGHTHFEPDRAFAWIHNAQQHADIWIPEQVLKLIEEAGASSVSGIQHFENVESIQRIIDMKLVMKSWCNNNIKGIKNGTEFCCHSSNPGIIYFTNDNMPAASVEPVFSNYNKSVDVRTQICPKDPDVLKQWIRELWIDCIAADSGKCDTKWAKILPRKVFSKDKKNQLYSYMKKRRGLDGKEIPPLVPEIYQHAYSLFAQ